MTTLRKVKTCGICMTKLARILENANLERFSQNNPWSMCLSRSPNMVMQGK